MGKDKSKKKWKRRVLTVSLIVVGALLFAAAGLFLAAGKELGGSPSGKRLERIQASRTTDGPSRPSA